MDKCACFGPRFLARLKSRERQKFDTCHSLKADGCLTSLALIVPHRSFQLSIAEEGGMDRAFSALVLASFALHVIVVDAADVIAFTIPSTLLANASQICDPRFAGFGIEFSNVFSFTGTAESPNTFSSNLLQNLKTVAGVAPCIRVGGNTQDNALYQSNYTGSQIGRNQYPTLMPTIAGYVPFDNDIYGDELFRALGTFPAGTQFIYGLNLAYDNPDYLEVITNTAKAVISALDDNIYSFEIGNEPDLYDSTAPYRIGQNWSGAVYTQEWVARSAAIQSQVYPFVNTMLILGSYPRWTTEKLLRGGNDSVDHRHFI
jgi:hypothetical protein